MAGDFDLWARFYQHEDLYGVDRPLACFRRHAEQKTTLNLPRYCAEARKTFTSFGGKAHGSWMAAARALVTRLPRWSRRLLVPLGMTYLAEIIVPARQAGKWRIVKAAI
jgi:hypothetical protein